MIPEAAVGAAAEALSFATSSEYPPEAWRDIARATLEAAAPLMLAGAWRSGFCAGSDHGADPFHPPAPNPYRPAP